MRSQKLTVHIGTHKTGTTAIQEMLRRNREWLLNKQVNYLDLPNCWASHNPFVHSLATTDDRTLKRLRSILTHAAVGGEHVVLSSEEISARISGTRGWDGFDQPNYWSRRRHFLDDLYSLATEITEPRILLCLREHDRYASSLYATNILSQRFDWDFPSFLKKCRPLFDYSSQVSVLRERFSDISIRSFGAIKNNLVTSFCGWSDIPVPPYLNQRVKVTPDARIIVWLQKFLRSESNKDVREAAVGFALSGEAQALFLGREPAGFWRSEAERNDFLASCTSPRDLMFSADRERLITVVSEFDLDFVQLAFQRWRGRRVVRKVINVLPRKYISFLRYLPRQG